MKQKTPVPFEQMISQSSVVLTEGGVVERIRRRPDAVLDPHIAHAGLIYDSAGRNILKSIFTSYIDIGHRYGLPFLSLAPTWRANPDRIQRSGFQTHQNINKDCILFQKEIRESYGDYAGYIYIGGMMACKGDAYQPEEALTQKDAEDFHRCQAELLAQSGVDFIKGATLPAVSEAFGMASAMAKTGTPYVLSFVVKPDGTILDDTPIEDAVELIDTHISPAPCFYMINCVHPSIFSQAMARVNAACPAAGKRILGLQANTSEKSPEELDNLSYLDTSEPVEFGTMIARLYRDFGLKILGGCCGSDAEHIKEIARQIKDKGKNQPG